MRDVASFNLRTFVAPWVSYRYAKADQLFSAEKRIFMGLRSEMRNKHILDIGVGGGRTTKALLEISADYLGIDFSPSMVARCKARHPGVAFQMSDARDLSCFEGNSFDLVVFSFNGIDYMSHADRMETLRGIRRILRDSGAFVFSSHNRAYEFNVAPWRPAYFRKLLRYKVRSGVRLLLSYPSSVVHHLMNRRHEESCTEYAIVNDEAHSFKLLTYYISVEKQIEQLERSGFTAIEVMAENERGLDPSVDAWLYYVARGFRQ
jgi:ubiquinone/menaquinone biosynthesis C-methylase UbiE